MSYKPRPLSARWLDGDCPPGVLAIYDNPTYADRYTIFYSHISEYPREGQTGLGGWIDYRAASENPFHPCGIGLYCQMRVYQLNEYRRVNGRRKCKWSDLPEKVKQLARQDLADEVAA